MPDLDDGESAQVQGSGSALYTLKNTAGVFSCTCPAWMHQSIAIERRTCKHLRKHRGEELETARVGEAGAIVKPRTARAVRSTSGGERVEGGEGGEGGESETKEPPLLLAHKWEMETDLTGWWMSEKLDGVRAYWDGENFFSRLGNRFHVPDWFKEGLPKTALDGELWGGRKRFQRTVGIVKRQDKSEAWREIRYVVFDAPGEKSSFEDRLALCGQLIAGLAHVAVLEHEPCRGHDHLREQLAFVESLGGEGLMMRKPGSRYEAGRSSTLLKVKSFFDTEARVLEHVPGAGRHKARLGALLVELSDGTRFNVGTGFSDAERESPPPIGAIITFRYQELSDGGVPRFPSYVGVRDDVRWVPTAKGDVAAAPHPAAERTRPQPPARSPPAPSPPARSIRVTTATADQTSNSTGRSEMARYEFSEGGSSKFWEISLDGASFTTRYGKIGTEGQTTLKEFDADAQARKEHDKLVAEKTKKGYELVGKTGGGAKTAAKAAPAAPAKAAPAKAAPAKAAPAPAAKPVAKAKSKGGARRFEFVEGSSAKFWEVQLEGSSYTARYGKIGTDGQVTLKEFDSPDKAQNEYDKIVAEKTKKGYVEQ